MSEARRYSNGMSFGLYCKKCKSELTFPEQMMPIEIGKPVADCPKCGKVVPSFVGFFPPEDHED